MTEAGSIVYKITGDASHLKSTLSSIGKDTSGIMSQTGSSMGGKLLSGLKTVFTVGAIAKIFKDTIGAGAELQQSLGGVETLFGNSANKVIENANKAWKTAGVSANKYMETVTSFSASLLQSLDQDTEKAADVANRIMIDMSDNANKMGTDMSLIQNAYQGFAKQNYTMLDNLKLGYGGTKTEAERLVKEAAEMTEIQEKLGITVDANSLDFANLANAISVVQEKWKIAGTTLDEGSRTLSGSFNAMKASFQDLLANIALGKDIEPSLQALVESTSTFLFDNLIPAIVNVVKLLPSALGNVLTEFLPDLMNKVSELIVNFCKYITENFPLILEKGMEILETIAKGIVDNFPTIINAIWEMSLSISRAVIDNLPMLLQKGIEIIGSILSGILKAIPDLFSKTRSAFASIDWWSIGANIISGIANGIWNGVSKVVDAAKSVARSAFNAAKSWLGISSPSKEFMFLGKMVDEGLAQGIDKNIGEVENSMKNITDSMLSTDLGIGNSTTNNSVNYGGIVINMSVQEGMNGQQLVNEMENELAKRTIRRKVVFA